MSRRPLRAVLRPALLSLFVVASSCGGTPAPTPAPPHAANIPGASSSSVSAPKDDGLPKAPVAKREPHETSIHGRTLRDDYFWMRQKKSPEVVSYLEAENAYTSAMTKSLEPMSQKLYDEMLARIKQDDDTPPVKDGAWRYYRRFETGKQYPIYCRKAVKDGASAPEIVMFDVNEMGKSEKFIDVTDVDTSDDGHLATYRIDTVGFRQYTLKVKDLRTNAILPEAIERVDDAAFAKDSHTIFYVTEDPQTKRANKLWRHVIGSGSGSGGVAGSDKGGKPDGSADDLIYEEKDEMFDLSVGRTRDKAFIVVTSSSKTTSETRVIDASKPTSTPRVITPRAQDHEYYVDHRAGLFYIRTNDKGRNFRLVTVPVADPRREKWTELLPTREDVMLERAILFKDHMIVRERANALPLFSIYDFNTKQTEKLDQADAIYDASPDHNPEFAVSTFRYRYQSPKTPPQIIEYDVKTKKRTVLKQTPVLGGFDATNYETKRITVTARDGTTKVPVSLVYKKGTEPDGTHPLYLSGYGSYGVSSTLGFSSERVSLLDRGMVWAQAHIRGGGDLGKKWHDQGRMKTKMNTFTDFIDVAERLKTEGWSKKDGLVIAGGSAGGLLMGAVSNMRPDLFRIVLAYVPFVDVINTMLDETLPLTISEFEEWGNPKKKDDFDYMFQYSPYDNVRAQPYPTMLVRTSYNDSQVMYWEPSKWVAKLRATKTNVTPLLFKINMQPAGHGGQSGRFDRLRDTAFDYAFVFSQLGIR